MIYQERPVTQHLPQILHQKCSMQLWDSLKWMVVNQLTTRITMTTIMTTKPITTGLSFKMEIFLETTRTFCTLSAFLMILSSRNATGWTEEMMDSISSLLSRSTERLKPCPVTSKMLLSGVVNPSSCPAENQTGTNSGHNALKRKKENSKSGKPVDAHL